MTCTRRSNFRHIEGGFFASARGGKTAGWVARICGDDVHVGMQIGKQEQCVYTLERVHGSGVRKATIGTFGGMS